MNNLVLGRDKLPFKRAIGVIWCIESDTFNFRILAHVEATFDDKFYLRPLVGFIAPVVLIGKKILQDICHSNSWDEPVDDATRSRWGKRRNELCLIAGLKVPRSFKPTEFETIMSAKLHCMSDSSTCGYGQCSYLRLEGDSGKVHVSFVMGNARVTPKRTVSMSRTGLWYDFCPNW